MKWKCGEVSKVEKESIGVVLRTRYQLCMKKSTKNWRKKINNFVEISNSLHSLQYELVYATVVTIPKWCFELVFFLWLPQLYALRMLQHTFLNYLRNMFCIFCINLEIYVSIEFDIDFLKDLVVSIKNT